MCWFLELFEHFLDVTVGHQLLLQKGLGLLQVLRWMSQIQAVIVDGTRCLQVGTASRSCSLSVGVGVWMLGPCIGLGIETPKCRCLHPSPQVVSEILISRGCLCLPRTGPCALSFSSDTSGGLKATHKPRDKQWDWAEREEKGDTDFCLGMGRPYRQQWVHVPAPAGATSCLLHQSCCWDGFSGQQHRDHLETDMLDKAEDIQHCQGLCLATW